MTFIFENIFGGVIGAYSALEGTGRPPKDDYAVLGKADNCFKSGEHFLGGQWSNAVYRIELEGLCNAGTCSAKSPPKGLHVDWHGWKDCAPMPGYECEVPVGSTVRVGTRSPLTGDFVVDAESPSLGCSRGAIMELVLPQMKKFGSSIVKPTTMERINFLCERNEWVRAKLVSCWYQSTAALALDHSPLSKSTVFVSAIERWKRKATSVVPKHDRAYTNSVLIFSFFGIV